MKNEVILWGGIGEKKSNNQRQWYQQDRIYDAKGIALCVSTSFLPWYKTGEEMSDKWLSQTSNDRLDGIRIRKLTSRECWRLMGFSDEAYDKASEVVSETQLYKQAGNSIVVPVLEAIFKNLL